MGGDVHVVMLTKGNRRDLETSSTFRTQSHLVLTRHPSLSTFFSLCVQELKFEKDSLQYVSLFLIDLSGTLGIICIICNVS